MPESLLTYRSRGTTLPYEELHIALENIIIDKVTTHSPKVKKIDTSAQMEIGRTAGTDGEEAFEEGYGKTSELAVQAVYKGTGAKVGWNGGKGPSWSVQKYFNSGKGAKGASRAGEDVGQGVIFFFKLNPAMAWMLLEPWLRSSRGFLHGRGALPSCQR